MNEKLELISLKDAKEYEQNPFILELKGKMYLQPRANTIIAKGQSIVDTSTGEIIDESVLIGKRKIVDKSQFAKIYASSIAILYELSKAGQNVFLYLTKVMDYDNKAFFMYQKDYKKLGYKSETASLRGLRELITKNIIACDVRPYHYWLNPTIVCKGERFAMYTEFVVGNDGENSKRLQNAEIKQQQIINSHLQESEVQKKYKKAISQDSLNSNNQINLLDQIAEFEE